MPFLDANHQNAIGEIQSLWGSLDQLSALAARHGIVDIFQDNGAKVLQQLIILNFVNIKGREGNDGIDERGVEWEMKSANVGKVKGFSTHHHLNARILAKYRAVPWSFAFYRNTVLEEIFVLKAAQLEPAFAKWEAKLAVRPSLNNPKISMKFVRSHGARVYPFAAVPVNPAEAA